jgi:hypothetical protein
MDSQAQLTKVKDRHILMMRRTMKIITNVLKSASHEELTTLRDGPDGWTPLEILCHLRDFNAVFFERARQTIEQESPALQSRDHLQMVIDGQYNQQDPAAVLADMQATREQMAAFYEALPMEAFARTAIHANYGLQTLMDFVMQVGHHDIDHLEQMTRVLTSGDLRG